MTGGVNNRATQIKTTGRWCAVMANDGELMPSLVQRLWDVGLPDPGDGGACGLGYFGEGRALTTLRKGGGRVVRTGMDVHSPCALLWAGPGGVPLSYYQPRRFRNWLLCADGGPELPSSLHGHLRAVLPEFVAPLLQGVWADALLAMFLGELSRAHLLESGALTPSFGDKLACLKKAYAAARMLLAEHGGEAWSGAVAASDGEALWAVAVEEARVLEIGGLDAAPGDSGPMSAAALKRFRAVAVCGSGWGEVPGAQPFSAPSGGADSLWIDAGLDTGAV